MYPAATVLGSCHHQQLVAKQHPIFLKKYFFAISISCYLALGINWISGIRPKKYCAQPFGIFTDYLLLAICKMNAFESISIAKDFESFLCRFVPFDAGAIDVPDKVSDQSRGCYSSN